MFRATTARRLAPLTVALRAVTPLAVALLLPACDAVTEDKACTAIGCTSGFDVDFHAQSFAAGTWQVEVVTPQDTRSCSVQLPFATIDPGVQCQGQLQLGTSGSALPASSHALVGVHLPDQPTAVTVTVRRDGQQVATQAYQPAYVTSQPNGPGCEPTCTQARADLSW